MFRIKSDTREFTIRDEQGEKYFDQCMQLLMGGKAESVDLDKILCMGMEQEEKGKKKAPDNAEKVKLISCMVPEISESTDSEKPVFTENTEHFFGGGGTKRPPKIKGFLHVVCDKCGEKKSYYAKENKDFHICSCGEKIELSGYNMRRMYVDCECGKSLYYWTNTTEGLFDMECIDCGAPVPICWNDKKRHYETIRS